MTEEKNIIKKIDGVFNVEFYESHSWVEVNDHIQQFILSELQALKEEVISERRTCEDGICMHPATGNHCCCDEYNDHRDYSKDVFEKFGIK